MKDALLTNAAYQVVARVSWQRAVVLVVTDQVDVVESHPADVIHSAGGLAIPRPTIVRQRRYVHVPQLALPCGESATRAGILLRDKRVCGYCGGRGDTIDHVVPKSRGGRDEWTNLIAACSPCNSGKGDRTPLEWGRRLLWLPYAPSAVDAEQERVWLALGAVA
jgi:5-methylcytosine-specific restriction endonuclease McrA